MKQSIEITILPDHAMITISSETEFTIRRMKVLQTMTWMAKQGLKWEWVKLEDGTAQAIWNNY